MGSNKKGKKGKKYRIELIRDWENTNRFFLFKLGYLLSFS